MAVCTTINRSSLEYLRIDGDFYHPKYIHELEIWESLSKSIPVKKLINLLAKPVRTGHTPKNRNIFKDDILVPFIKTDTLRVGKIDLERTTFLPQRCLTISDYIEENACLVTIIGATKEIVGRVAIRRSDDPVMTTNQNVAIINFQNSIDAYYAMIYLQSKYGRDQLWRHSRQTEQVNLNCREVERILFPVFPVEIQKEIGNLIRESFNKQKLSLTLYAQATKILKQALGLDIIQFEKAKSYTAKFSDVIINNRSDSEFFNPKYNVHLNVISLYKYGFSKLNSLSIRTDTNFINTKSKSSELYYIEIGDINVSDGSFVFKKIPSKDAPANAKIKLSGGEILMSMVRPTRGAITIVPDILPAEPVICSGAFYVFKIKSEIYREITWLYLRLISKCFEKYCTGTSYPTIEPKYFSSFQIPNFDKKLAEEIKELVAGLTEAKEQSKLLLEQAKTQVENLIEGAIKQ